MCVFRCMCGKKWQFKWVLCRDIFSCRSLSVLIARTDLIPLSFRVRWPQWGCGYGCPGWYWDRAEEDVGAEEDIGADAPCVADGVDRVRGELCSCATKAAAVGSQGTCSLHPNKGTSLFLKKILHLFSTLGGCGFSTQMQYMQTHLGCYKMIPFVISWSFDCKCR